jgi:hypothetical protein
MTIFPTENGVLLLINVANISVPSKAPSFLKTIPTPIPRIPPPKTAPNNGSFVRGSTSCSNSVNIDASTIPYKL